MFKKCFLILSLILIILSFIWVNCNPFNSSKNDSNTESMILDELDGPDDVKATPPEQPVITWTTALTAFRDTLDEELNLRIIVTEVAGNPAANYQISYYWTGVSYESGLLAGSTTSYARSYYNVYATETSVKVLTETIHMYYGANGSGVGSFFFNGVKFLMAQHGMANPTDLEVLCYMDRFRAYKIIELSTGERWIIIQMIPYGDAPYENVYIKLGETVYRYVEGYYVNFSDLP